MAQLATKEIRKIYYDNTSKFVIHPRISKSDRIEFTNHLEKLKSNYKNDIGFINFWTYDVESNAIIIDENTDMVDNDIFSQFCSIAFWLFSKNYTLKGSFHCKFGKYIEYISSDGKNSIISHCMLMDNVAGSDKVVPPKTFKNLGVHTKPNKVNIIKDAKNKINKYFINNQTFYPRHRLYKNTKPMNNKHIDQKNVSSDIQNEIRTLTNINETLWKICTIITLVTFTSIIYYTFMDTDKNNIYIHV